MKKHKVFLVEDDENFGSVLQSYLEMNDYSVLWVKDGAKAQQEYTVDDFDICILDVMLPNVDGFSLAREIKSIDSNVPMIFLTAKTLKKDILQGYELGADDYITKPFDSDVLLCKIRAILNRNTESDEPEQEYKLGRYLYDAQRRVLSIADHKRKLSPKEGDLLKLFIEHKGRVLNREKALKLIWGQDDYFTGRSMDVYITRLRKYLKDDPAISIENVHGSGYVLRLEE
jgi:DNA-binding response OmpR family regulator